MAEANPVTPGQNQQNLNEAAGFARDQVGLLEIPEAQWTAQDQAAYILAFKNLILANPEMFFPETVDLADAIKESVVQDYAQSYASSATNIERLYLTIDSTVADAVSSVMSPWSKIPGQVAETTGALVSALKNAGAAINNAMNFLGSAPVLTIVLIGGALLLIAQQASGPIKDVRGIFR